jgi:hypothetical protein
MNLPSPHRQRTSLPSVAILALPAALEASANMEMRVLFPLSGTRAACSKGSRTEVLLSARQRLNQIPLTHLARRGISRPWASRNLVAWTYVAWWRLSPSQHAELGGWRMNEGPGCQSRMKGGGTMGLGKGQTPMSPKPGEKRI